MRCKMTCRSLRSLVAMVVLSSCTITTLAAPPPVPQAIGRVTAAFGNAHADTAISSRPLDIQSLINNDEQIVTDGGGITVLLASRVVLKVDVHTSVSVFEGNSQTTLTLQQGTVHVFVGQRPDQLGPVCIIDPNGNVQTATGVVLIHYDPAAHQSYYACEHLSAIAQPINDDKPMILAADHQSIVKDGKCLHCGDLDRGMFDRYKLSLDRLAQSQNSRGADTFRLRSRAFDMESAFSQLSAAGWI